MKRGIAVLLSVSVLATVGYFTASKWAIRHETVRLYDSSRGNRLVEVDIAVRRDREMQAEAGMIKLPVAVLNHGGPCPLRGGWHAAPQSTPQLEVQLIITSQPRHRLTVQASPIM